MASHKDETKQYHRARIQEAMVLNPRASVKEIAELLEYANPPLVLSREYVGKVIQKIYAERLIRYDRAHLNKRIAEMEDRTQSVIGQMWKLVLNPKNAAKERAQAAKVIIEADRNLLEAQMDAGIFDRKIGTVGIEHTHEHTLKLPEEIRTPILRAFKNYGIIRDAKIIEHTPLAAAATGGDLQR